MQGREERSKGIEICIADAFAIIKPTALFKFAKHEARRKRNWSDSSGNSLAKADSLHGERARTRVEFNHLIVVVYYESLK